MDIARDSGKTEIMEFLKRVQVYKYILRIQRRDTRIGNILEGKHNVLPLSPPSTSHFHMDTTLLIFSYLTFPDLNTCMFVCKEWRQIALHPSAWKNRSKELFYLDEKYEPLCEDILLRGSHVYHVFLAFFAAK